jgi:hypothetical protein
MVAGRQKLLMVNCPPRLMKSILVSVMWPTWAWAARPETRWVFASYSAASALKHSLDSSCGDHVAVVHAIGRRLSLGRSFTAS